MADRVINKIMLAIRHTVKGGPGEYGDVLSDTYIGPQGRQRIADIQLPEDFTDLDVDFFGSGQARTFQELLEFSLSHFMSGTAHDPLLNMGSHELFIKWFGMGIHEAARQAGSVVLGLKKLLGEEEFNIACQKCGQDIRDAFNVMTEPYGLALGVFHTPTIEMAGLALGSGFTGKLKEDNGMVFVQYKDDEVAFYSLWRPGDPIPEIGSTK